MSDRDYYPAGAYNDANAPYNQMPDDYFDTEIEERVDKEIAELDYHYLDWIESLLNITFDSDNNLREIGKILAKEDKAREEYHQSRYDDVYQDVITAHEYD